MIKILIVDDSPIVRSIFSREFERTEDFTVVGAAPDPFVARDLVVEKKPDVMIIQLGELAKKKALKIFDEMVAGGINVKEALHKDSIKSQLRLAGNLEVKFAVIMGQKEALDKTVLVRDMESGIQEIVSLEKVVPELKKRLKDYKK